MRRYRSPNQFSPCSDMRNGSPICSVVLSPSWVRVIPFGLYLVFLSLTAGAEWIAEHYPSQPVFSAFATVWHYPIKIAIVGMLLLAFWSRYEELKAPLVTSLAELGLAVGVGILVYLAWVRMDWAWATQGITSGYNPFEDTGWTGWGLAGIRLFGASVVVPVMEELFWRSFLLRYLIAPTFRTVPLGMFTPLSLVMTTAFFGFEHHLWLAGMLAGLAYTLLLYYTKRLWPCIIAHGVTNLCLGVHVLVTHEWRWW